MRIWIWISSLVLGAAGMTVLAALYSPRAGGFWIVPAMYLSVFMFFYGMGSLAGFGIRSAWWEKQARNEMIRISSRQGTFLGLMSVSILLLLAQDLFNWWSAGLLFLIFILLELYAR